ncbi:hypothetical protein C3B64_00940 [Clostridium botulinum]|uniref:Protein CR006 P-loop domain-containing protein n=1 Tax=Clostridium botulinum TaxID=1491 RepID=A0AAU8YSJ8_CLOBO|nr:AAA family ATPase [Clostridium sporogenes]AVP62895.1 hypothetical protein C3B64_00940 [Clostridium botulinum]MCF4018387.1 hypothetical protein [Clostridium sporogenes]NFG01892.1 hypothetical protein [Clostridium sporogenes]
MDKIKINFTNCFGIKELQHTFDFTSKRACSIYAPNGTMKTSFAKTVKCISNEEAPQDLINTEKVSDALIIKSNGDDVSSEDVFVIESYKEDYESKKVSMLMVNKELKAKYDKIHSDLEKKKDTLLKEISPLCGIKSKDNIEIEISNAWGRTPRDIFQCFEEIESLIEDFSFPVNIKYKTIINEKVIEFLKDKDTKILIKEYIEKYDELITKSQYFTKGVFNHNNVSVIGKNLNDNGFFKVKNKVIIKDKEINSKKELDDLLEGEKSKIFNNADLLIRFEKLDEKLNKNAAMKELRTLLENTPEIISYLDNIDSLKKEIWLSYLNQKEEEIKALVDMYKLSKEQLKKIVEEAKRQKTAWDQVVEIFNERFDVPFIVEIDNQQDVILKENTPTINFKYNESGNYKDVDRTTLINVLSNGEKRALYILNLIFEIEALIKLNKDVLVVIDDIADSFDYKNKYAIVEYLNDILKSGIFRMIILTHNFDFYRTVINRLGIPRNNSFMVHKNDNNIKLVQGGYLKNIFNVWKDEINSKDRIMIASIPFVRNLSEYLEVKNSPNFLKLTSLLHIKDGTNNITVADLESIYNEVWRVPKKLNAKSRKVVSVLFEEAEKVVQEDTERINLENKIVLSMAIRLLAEEFMMTRISEKEKIKNITRNQTCELLKLYKEENNDISQIKVLEEVNLMTPENIHINSFMYEPILDLSDSYLKKLYSNIKEMQSVAYEESALHKNEDGE